MLSATSPMIPSQDQSEPQLPEPATTYDVPIRNASDKGNRRQGRSNYRKQQKKQKKIQSLNRIMQEEAKTKQYQDLIDAQLQHDDMFAEADLPQEILLESLLLAQQQQLQDEKDREEDEAKRKKEQMQQVEQVEAKPDAENASEISVEQVVKVEENAENASQIHNAMEKKRYYEDLLLAMEIQRAEQDAVREQRAREEALHGKYHKFGNEPTGFEETEFVYEDEEEILAKLAVSNTHAAETAIQVQAAAEDAEVEENHAENHEKNEKKKRRRRKKKKNNGEMKPMRIDHDRLQELQELDRQGLLEKPEVISKHDAEVWSSLHRERLNKFCGVDMDQNDVHVSNKPFNSLKYRLEKKGFMKDQPLV